MKEETRARGDLWCPRQKTEWPVLEKCVLLSIRSISHRAITILWPIPAAYHTSGGGTGGRAAWARIVRQLPVVRTNRDSDEHNTTAPQRPSILMWGHTLRELAACEDGVLPARAHHQPRHHAKRKLRITRESLKRPSPIT